MGKREWVRHVDPNNKYGATFTLGDRELELPPDAVVSVTRGEQFNIPRLIINGIVNQLVMKQLAKNENLIYAELSGQMQGGIGQTMTVWRGKDMQKFRDSGAHKFALRFFSWVFYSGKVGAYFHTWRAVEIPTAEEATAVVKEHGRYFVGGKKIRGGSRPVA
jgi:hypothetical protein